MPATPIKPEPDLVNKVMALKPQDESISGFVRAWLEREHRVRENRTVAVVYQEFLQENPGERAAMEVGESAPLVDEVESKKP